MLDSILNMIDKIRKAPASKITVNGHSIVGRNVNIVNGKVIVDGKEIDFPQAKEINVTIEGDLGTLLIDSGNVTIQGSVGEVDMNMGPVNIAGDAKGSISVDQGNVTCNDVYGDVSTEMGSIKASTIHGNATTQMGNITK